MSNPNTFEQWCQVIRQRLPEILIKLPAWPKGYRNWIPQGLFFEGSDWSPQKAIQEVESHLKRLESLQLSQSQAFFLSEKILRQIEVLVLLSKQFPQNFHMPLNFKGLTREQHRLELEQYHQMLSRQKNALEQRLKTTPNDLSIQHDMQNLEKKIMEIQDRLTKV